MPKLVEIVDLVTNFYTYEGVVRALNRISLTVEHGVTFGLVGESGCGKSVLVRSLMRIIQEPGRIDGGQILFYP
jgi:peptide/nickel transport system ATP-binding protein